MPQAPTAAAIAVRNIPLEHLEGLQLVAKRDGITREQLVRKLIKECVEKNCEPA